MKVLGYVVLTIVVGLVLILAVGHLTMPPGYAEWQDKKQNMTAFCGNALSDSAPGSDRRQTRAMCDDFQARLEAERPRSR